MDAFAVKESLNGMLRCPCLSHELPKWIASCSEDESSIGRARFQPFAVGKYLRAPMFSRTLTSAPSCALPINNQCGCWVWLKDRGETCKRMHIGSFASLATYCIQFIRLGLAE